MKILIAEDDSVSRRLLEATLVEWGYDVEVAREGKEAWARLQSARLKSTRDRSSRF